MQARNELPVAMYEHVYQFIFKQCNLSLFWLVQFVWRVMEVAVLVPAPARGREMDDDVKKKEVWCVISDTMEEQVCFF